jgi:hypothetical protein
VSLIDCGKRRTIYERSEQKAKFMRCVFLAAVIVFSSPSAFALQTTVAKATKIGSGCVGPVVSLALKLRTCAIAGAKTRIWCPNGQIFDDDGAKTSASLARSLCNLAQVSE